jgi:flagellar M-ring protein FliF
MPLERKQLILFAGLFTAVVIVLSLGYFLFLKPDFGALYEDIRDTDAAAIVAELEAQGIEYRLGDNGHRVLVPRADIDRARVLIAGSGIAMGGVVGFELFNDSDMGLTEFAQKVNYQRALQGELARTIMMMDGVEFARVHLSIPERSLFRADATEPKAAVTVERQRGRRLGQERVRGMQRLIASAVTGLEARDVAILDETGQLLSAASEARISADLLDERSALEQYFRARAQAAANAILEGVPLEVRVNAIGGVNRREAAASGNDPADPSGNDDVEAGSSPHSRDFRLRMAIRTEDPLAREDEDLARSAVERAVEFDTQAGDMLVFETGPLGAAHAGNYSDGLFAAPGNVPSEQAQPVDLAIPAASIPASWNSVWLALIVIAGAGFALFLIRRKRRLSPTERQSFATMLEARLTGDEDLLDAR